MATLNFLLKGKNELSTIYVRLRDGRNTDITVSTGYYVSPQHWSVSRRNVKASASNNDKVNLETNLKILNRGIIDLLNTEKGKGIEINKQWIESVIERIKNPLIDTNVQVLIDLIEVYKENMKLKVNNKTGKPTSLATLRNFNTTINRLKLYESNIKKNLLIYDVDLTFHSKYIKFATDTLKLSVNSIGKDIKTIKTICIDARDRGIKINEQVLSRKFNVISEPTMFVTLTEDEIKKIKNFKGVDYLQNARDWLIIGCWTGCRVNDLMQLTNDNILITQKGQKFIRYTQSKTGKQVDIPIHSDVQEILDRLGNFPRPISDQRFNDWIKEVCKDGEVKINELVKGTRQNPKTHKKEVGMFEKWQLVRSHTCRRSFATNHYNKLPNKIIMAVTGHATEQMLLKYIGETEHEHIDDFLSVWENDKKIDNNIIELNTASNE